jgi:hypothetical protein
MVATSHPLDAGVGARRQSQVELEAEPVGENMSTHRKRGREYWLLSTGHEFETAWPHERRKIAVASSLKEARHINREQFNGLCRILRVEADGSREYCNRTAYQARTRRQGYARSASEKARTMSCGRFAHGVGSKANG